MAVIVGCFNQKGGSGKSTVSLNVARGLQKEGYSVLFIDSDPQGSARTWRAIAAEDEPNADFFPVIGIDRATLHVDLPSVAKPYDFAIIDGVSSISGGCTEITVSGIKACDFILIPLMPSALDFWATEPLVDVIKTRQEMTGGTPRAAFIVNAQIDGTNLSKEIAEAGEGLGLPMFSSRTSHLVSYKEAIGKGCTVFESGYRARKAREQIQEIVSELLSFINMTKEVKVVVQA